MEGAGSGSSAPARVDRALWLYSVLVAFTTAGAWGLYRLLHSPPHLRPLFIQSERFGDLTKDREKIAHLSDGAAALTTGRPIFNYPAPAAYVFKVFFLFGDHAARAYLIFILLCAAGLATVLWRASGAGRQRRVGAAVAIVITALLGYPFWITADRANMEGVVWALSAAGLCLFLRARYAGAAILIGVSAAIKPFPVLLLLLLVRRRRYREALLGAVVAGGLVISALAALGPTPLQAYRDFELAARLYTRNFVLLEAPVDEARFEHSPLDGLKSALLTLKMRGFHPQLAEQTIAGLRARPEGWRPLFLMERVDISISAIAFLMLIYVFSRLPTLNQVTALCVAVSLLPPISADYTLLELYVPFGAFLVFLTREVATGRVVFAQRWLTAFVVIYALLFAPLTFLHIYAGDAKLLLLLALLVVAARSPMPSEYFGDATAVVA